MRLTLKPNPDRWVLILKIWEQQTIHPLYPHKLTTQTYQWIESFELDTGRLRHDAFKDKAYVRELVNILLRK